MTAGLSDCSRGKSSIFQGQGRQRETREQDESSSPSPRPRPRPRPRNDPSQVKCTATPRAFAGRQPACKLLHSLLLPLSQSLTREATHARTDRPSIKSGPCTCHYPSGDQSSRVADNCGWTPATNDRDMIADGVDSASRSPQVRERERQTRERRRPDTPDRSADADTASNSSAT